MLARQLYLLVYMSVFVHPRNKPNTIGTWKSLKELLIFHIFIFLLVYLNCKVWQSKPSMFLNFFQRFYVLYSYFFFFFKIKAFMVLLDNNLKKKNVTKYFLDFFRPSSYATWNHVSVEELLGVFKFHIWFILFCEGFAILSGWYVIFYRRFVPYDLLSSDICL